MTIKILIADDHPVVREGLKQILSQTSDMVVAGEASTSQEVLNKLWKHDYDVVLLDISMPGRTGMDILQELKSIRPKLRILVLSIHPEEQYAMRVLRAGASGYLTKDSTPEELLAAIRKVSAGGKYISTSLSEKLAFDLESDADRPPHEKLSNREYQVMQMIASGKTVQQIAQELILSPKTISTYRSRILEKMKMKSNVELIHYAMKHDLLD